MAKPDIKNKPTVKETKPRYKIFDKFKTESQDMSKPDQQVQTLSRTEKLFRFLVGGVQPPDRQTAKTAERLISPRPLQFLTPEEQAQAEQAAKQFGIQLPSRNRV